MNKKAKKESIIDLMDGIFNGLFDEQYTIDEIKWYNLPEHQADNIEVKSVVINGRNDNYLNKEFAIGNVEAPILKINGELWMSLTPMEIQSAGFAIANATGDIATAGLGMGYFTLKAAELEEVNSIDVYEINPDVIKFFTDNFSDREGYDKINIIEGDVRETMAGKTYDMVYNDIYQTMLPDEIMDDITLLTENNDIDMYLFWGYELVVWSSAEQGYLEDTLLELSEMYDGSDISLLLRAYFREFAKDDRRVSLSHGDRLDNSDGFIDNTLRLMAKANQDTGLLLP